MERALAQRGRDKMNQIVLLTNERPASVEEAADWVTEALTSLVPDGARPWSRRRVLAGLEKGALSRMPMDLPTHRWVHSEAAGKVHAVRVNLRVGAAVDASGSAAAERAVGSGQPGIELEVEGWQDEAPEIAVPEDAGPRFVTAARAGRFSSGWVGPRTWMHQRLNLWSLVERPPERRLPDGASCEPLGGAFLLKAAAGREPSAARVREAATWFDVESNPAPVPLPPAPLPPAPVVPVAPPAVPPGGYPSPDETLPIPLKVASLGLPFQPSQRALAVSGSLSAEEVASRAAASTPPRAAAGNVNVDETVMLPKQTTAVVVGEGLRERLAPKAIPVLSLDEYAELRAGLTVFGADHAPTLARFGVGEPMVAEIVRQRFASAFTGDDRLRERFVARLQEYVAALRTRDGSGAP
jgi:hypothetical protein